MAGSKAGLSYNTWPLMDGLPVPPLEDLFVVTPWYENFFDNVALVPFQHRAVAYFLLALVCVHAIMAKRVVPGSILARQAKLVVAIVLIQVLLGVMTLILIVPLWAALSHQIVAMAALAAAVWHAGSVSERRSPSPIPMPSLDQRRSA